MTQISIQSVRWPQSRFVSAEDDIAQVTTASQRSTVDATIWVSPLCTSRSGRVPEVCMPTFKAASCYPYCMAARLKGSSSQSLVLYSANEWRERVHLMHRDCSMLSMSSAENLLKLSQQKSLEFLPNGTSAASNSLTGTVETSAPITPVDGSSVLISSPSAVVGCIQSSMSQSMVGKDVLINQLSSSVNNNNYFRSILLQGQPFAYAGA